MADLDAERANLIERMQDFEARHEINEMWIQIGLAEQIRAMRQERGWTQAELGRRAELHQSRISALENPNSPLPSIATLVTLANVFDCALIIRFIPFSQLVELVLAGDSTPPPFDHDPGLAEPTP